MPNRQIGNFNRLMNELAEELNIDKKDFPSLHMKQFEKPVLIIFGGGSKMTMNVVKQLIMLGYLSVTATPMVFKIEKWELL